MDTHLVRKETPDPISGTFRTYSEGLQVMNEAHHSKTMYPSFDQLEEELAFALHSTTYAKDFYADEKDQSGTAPDEIIDDLKQLSNSGDGSSIEFKGNKTYTKAELGRIFRQSFDGANKVLQDWNSWFEKRMEETKNALEDNLKPSLELIKSESQKFLNALGIEAS